jgi:hypothetical protein
MPPLNIDPHKRIAVVLFHLESAFKEARDAATGKNTPKLLRSLEAAFDLINPLLASLEILSEKEKRSLVERFLDTPN